MKIISLYIIYKKKKKMKNLYNKIYNGFFHMLWYFFLPKVCQSDPKVTESYNTSNQSHCTVKTTLLYAFIGLEFMRSYCEKRCKNNINTPAFNTIPEACVKRKVPCLIHKYE